MMADFVNPADFLPRPEAIKPLDFETLQLEWLTEMAARDPDFNAGSLQPDPGVKVAEAFNVQRLLDRAHVNDAYNALRLARATGANLDARAAEIGVTRLVYEPATATTPAVMEEDESLRIRTWLKMQTWGTGSPQGVEFYARTFATKNISDAFCDDFVGEGRMLLVLLEPPQGTMPDDFDFNQVVVDVANYVNDRSRRPGAVWIDVVAAEILTYNQEGVQKIRRGASKEANLTEGEARWRIYMNSRRRIGADIPFSAIDATQVQGHVIAFEWPNGNTPVDFVVSKTQAAEPGEYNVTAEYTDE